MSFTLAESRLQAYETLRELVRKVECGEIEILDMSITQEAPETRDSWSIDGRSQRMLVRNGELSVVLKLALRDPLRSEPRDDRGRFVSRGETGPPKRGVNTRDYGAMTREELMQVAGMTAAQRLTIEEEILRDEIGGEPLADMREGELVDATQEPADPLRYGARKLDID